MYINVLTKPDDDFIGWVQVWLDGVIPANCYAAHEEEGWIESHLTDASGRYLLDGKRTAILKGRRYGQVRLRCREDAPLDICQRFVAARGCV